MPRHRKLPISAIDPRLIGLLLMGAKKKLTIRFNDDKRPHQLAQHLNAARKRLAEEKDPRWEAAYAAIVSVRAKDRIIEIRPRGSEFEDIFQQIGVTREDGGDLPPPSTTPTPDETSAIEDLLASIGAKTEEGK